MILTEEQKNQLEWLHQWQSGGDEYVFVPMTDVLDILDVEYELKDGKLVVVLERDWND
jgi:hypothetical protein